MLTGRVLPAKKESSTTTQATSSMIRLRTRVTIEVRQFFYGVPPFQSLRPLQKRGLEKNKTATGSKISYIYIYALGAYR